MPTKIFSSMPNNEELQPYLEKIATIKDYLKNGSLNEPNSNFAKEVSQGMFLHCLTVALEQLKLESAEIEDVNKHKLESKFERLQADIDMLKLHHRIEEREYDDEDDIAAAAKAKKAQEQLGKLYFAELFDPKSLLKLEANLDQLTMLVSKAANVINPKEALGTTGNPVPRHSPFEIPKLHPPGTPD